MRALVAERITAYLAGVQDRVQAAERRACRRGRKGRRGAAAAQGPACTGGLGAGAHDAGRAEHDVLPPAASRRGPRRVSESSIK